jgi:hypothetical protein
VFAALVIAGCGEHDERSMCAAYDQFVASLQEFTTTDVTAATVGDAAATLQDIEVEVAQLRAVADGYNEAMVADLDQRLRDIINTLTTLDDEVPFSAVQDLVADDTAAVLDAAAEVDDEFESICNPPD